MASAIKKIKLIDHNRELDVLTQESNDKLNIATISTNDDSIFSDCFDDFDNSCLNKSIYIDDDDDNENDYLSITSDFNAPSLIESDFNYINAELKKETPHINDNFNTTNWKNDTIFASSSYNKIDENNIKKSLLNKSFKNNLSILNDGKLETSKLSLSLSNTKNEILNSASLSCTGLEFDDWSQELKINDDSNSFYGLPDRVKSLIFKIKKINSLYEWQNQCLNLPSIKNRKNLIYSLPTSGGKTLVAEILMLKQIICYKKNSIFILPFISIVQEKIQSMAPYGVDFDFLLEEYAANKGQYPPIKRRKKNSIYICTIEKALGLINSLIETKRLDEIGMVVVDELHLLGENGGRGACLEVLLTKLLYANDNIHIIGMSATIGNLAEIAEFLKADMYVENFRPVELKEYVKCEDKMCLVDVKEENIFQDCKTVKYPYSKKYAILDPDKIGGLVMDVVPNDSCLIFCSTKKNCESLAGLLTHVLFNHLKKHKEAEKQLLLDALKTESKLCPILAETIKYGVAYHHSGLTTEERKLIEDGFREGVLCVICATSTLAAGVNLPARRVILRKPYIGNQFLNLSRYKQMIGRAGRAGMGQIGEIEEMLTSKMDDCLSTLHQETDRGINYLILSGILLSLVKTREEIHRLVSFSLLGLQAKRRDINIKEIVDQSIINLVKSNALLIDKKIYNSNFKIEISSQKLLTNNHDDDITSLIDMTMMSHLELSNLGKAAMKANIDLKTAYILAEDLKTAQKQLILLNDLHLLYLITPYDFSDKFKVDGLVLYDVIMSLPESLMVVSRLLGINEMTVIKLREGVVPKSVSVRVISRFYLTLILYELNNQQSIHIVAEKYKVDRGWIQNIMISSASFANCIIKFCQEIPEFWAFPDLIKVFTKKLSYGCSGELEILMELPTVKAGRARQLYNAGYKTLQSIATADAKEIAEKIRYMPKSSISRIISSAHLLLKEKIENLKDEYAEMMDDLDPNLPDF
ncbi:hypothetical protein HCN44_002968 [Aphidius gifuensis]|uniref:Helicase POLQ-like n=1 Tax=Aphidius gifuensis TaxID=684658 RepID=A0A834XRE0_APHGI|nr:hypothetical protein HCN44_002968 [Aphidius gifuensis]